MRISDLSSDVCSSDLHGERLRERGHDFALALVDESGDLLIGQLPHELFVFLEALGRYQRHQQGAMIGMRRRINGRQLIAEGRFVAEIGRESCRESVCKYVMISVGAVSLKNTNI